MTTKPPGSPAARPEARCLRRHAIHRVLGLCALLALAGCASVPLSTMARFGDFGDGDFVRIDPSEVLVQVSFPRTMSIDPDRTALSVTLETPSESLTRSFSLDLVSETRARSSGGRFEEPVDLIRQTFRLDAEGIAGFRLAQRAVAGQAMQRGTLEVNWFFREVPSETGDVRRWVDLRLSAQEGFFPPGKVWTSPSKDLPAHA